MGSGSQNLDEEMGKNNTRNGSENSPKIRPPPGLTSGSYRVVDLLPNSSIEENSNTEQKEEEKQEISKKKFSPERSGNQAVEYTRKEDSQKSPGDKSQKYSKIPEMKMGKPGHSPSSQVQVQSPTKKSTGKDTGQKGMNDHKSGSSSPLTRGGLFAKIGRGRQSSEYIPASSLQSKKPT